MASIAMSFEFNSKDNKFFEAHFYPEKQSNTGDLQSSPLSAVDSSFPLHIATPPNQQPSRPTQNLNPTSSFFPFQRHHNQHYHHYTTTISLNASSSRIHHGARKAYPRRT